MSSGRFYAGLGLLTFSTLTLEISQTRLLSVVTWYHLAFFVISMAMFGMTGGAVWVYLRRDRFEDRELGDSLTRFSSAFALSTALALLLQITLAPSLVYSVSMLVVFTQLALIIATPFFFSGVAVTLALTRSPFPIGRVYSADLAGAALGCLGVLWLLDWTDAPSVILLSGAGAAGAATLFSTSVLGGRPSVTKRPSGILAHPLPIFMVLLVAGLLNGLTSHGIQPILVKDAVVRRDGNLLYEKWNSFSRIAAGRMGITKPVLWGPSPTLPAEVVVDQIHLNIDGLAGSTMFRFDGKPESADFLEYDVTNTAYFLRRTGRSAVIGVGSGRDVLSAWHFGLRDVTGVEMNPIFIHLLTGNPLFTRFAGLSELPGIRFIVDEARSWFTRTEEKFDLIQMSMIDTWAATGAGAFALSENGLYTIEAWRIFMSRLTPHGIFTVSRWYDVGEVNETGRMISLAVASLLESSVAEPRRHIAVVASGQIATLIASPSPLSTTDLATVRQVCERYGYRILVAPDQDVPPSGVLGDILAAKDRDALERSISGLDLDLSPPTDTRPFFFNMLPLSRPYEIVRMSSKGGVMRGNLQATATLMLILLIALVLVVATIIVPLEPAIRQVGRPLAIWGTLFFALLGLGFMFIEMGLLQRLSVFLGHPIYSLSIVLFSLILATGGGSFLSESARIDQSWIRMVIWSGALGGYLITLPSWIGGPLRAFESAPLSARALLSVGIIAPAGILMGFGFPCGMRAVQKLNPGPTPWFWGINGAAGVLASVAAVALSITYGINVTLILGGLCYLALIPVVLFLRPWA